MADATVPVKTFNQVAQAGHFAGGLAWVSSWLVLLGQGALVWVLLAGVALAAGKEFWYDAKYEDEVVRGSSLEDFAFYCIGFVTGVFVYGLSRW
jgi:hypothetical protein